MQALPPSVMIVNYDLPSRIQYGSTIPYDTKQKIPRILFFSPSFEWRKDLLEGAVHHLLGVTREHCSPLHDLLCKYCNMFLGQLPKKAPPNRKLVDVHSILVEPGTESVYKRTIPSQSIRLTISKVINIRDDTSGSQQTFLFVVESSSTLCQ